MGRIARLESSLVDRIAAGEVIERPASVLKELVENALDAGATRIRVEVEGAGLTLLRVLDDGDGIAAEDLPLALERHATSKIRQASDLERIRTLGFRGEALPSIAAVSRLRLASRARGAREGAEIETRGGRVAEPRPTSHAGGTLVEVRDLFFNTPARRKFLRSPAGESRALTLLVSQFAMAYPGVHFVHQHEGRTLLDAPAVRTLRERAAAILGVEAAQRLLEVRESGEGGCAVGGMISDAGGARGNRGGQWLYVNGRLIRDRGLAYALQEAASDFIPKDRHAVAFLFLSLPAADLDVNVHPAKTEVRFARPEEVRTLLARAIRSCAHQSLRFREVEIGAARPALARREAPGLHGAPAFHGTPALHEVPRGLDALATSEPPPAWGRMEEPEVREGAVARPLPLGAGSPEFLRPLCQFRESFLLATDGRDLLLVDQHAAHERILYERILREWDADGVQRQALLLPLPVSLSPEEMLALEFLQPVLEGAGFRIEPFGEREVILREAPAVAAGLERTEELLRAMLEEADEAKRGRSPGSLRDRLAASCACHAAIQIHTPLSREKMEFILAELLKTRVPLLCPHGRPIVLRLTERSLERSFGRCGWKRREADEL